MNMHCAPTANVPVSASKIRRLRHAPAATHNAAARMSRAHNPERAAFLQRLQVSANDPILDLAIDTMILPAWANGRPRLDRFFRVNSIKTLRQIVDAYPDGLLRLPNSSLLALLKIDAWLVTLDIITPPITHPLPHTSCYYPVVSAKYLARYAEWIAFRPAAQDALGKLGSAEALEAISLILDRVHRPHMARCMSNLERDLRAILARATDAPVSQGVRA